MLICKFCGEEFSSKRSRGQHLKCHPEWKLEQKSQKEEKRRESDNYVYVCIGCDAKLINRKSLLSHQAGCDHYRSKYRIWIQSKLDFILFEYKTRSANSIAIELAKSNKDFSITASGIIALLKNNGIKTRSVSDSCYVDTSRIQKANTCMVRYGDSNPLGRNSSKFLEKNQTVLSRYGVQNIFQAKWVKDQIFSDALYLERYNKAFNEFKSESTKKVWSKYTEAERAYRCKSSAERTIYNYKQRTGLDYSDLLSEGQIRRWGNTTKERKSEIFKKVIATKKENNTLYPSFKPSSLEELIEEFLKINCISYKTQWFIHISNEKIRFYDFYIPHKNLLIEVNGDYWHANPIKYNESDIIPYPGNVLLRASDIWEKDYQKYKLAANQGYDIIYLWENDIINSFDIVVSYLMGELYENSFDKKDPEIC
jgi:very-short-patch-repair endonuclease